MRLVTRSRGGVWLAGLLGIFGLADGWQALAAREISEKIEVKLVLEADKGSYARGEPILLTLRIMNRTPRPVSLHFRSGQRYDLVVEDPQGRQVWRWSTGQVFTQALGEETLRPAGGELAYRVTVRERLRPSRYTVTGIVPAEEGPMSASVEILIAKNP
jgi:intracellular proteinase inhibitor BsuPI